MALYWPEARMALVCVGDDGKAERREEACEPGTLVIHMTPEQAGDPEFVGAMRRLVLTRTLERERELLEGLCGARTGQMRPSEPQGREARGDSGTSRLREAERRFEELFMDDLGPREDPGEDRDERDGAGLGEWDGYPGLDELLTGAGAGWPGWGMAPRAESPLVQVVIERCNEVVVGA